MTTISDELTIVASLVENSQRLDMHPSEQLSGFRQLSEQGKTPAQIGAQLGYGSRHVQRMLKLANLAPELITLLAENKLDMEQYQALCLEKDPVRQVEIYTQVKASYNQFLMKKIINTAVLATRIPCELEDYRAGGENVRRSLTHAVMHDLNAPPGWTMNGEYRGEFGGFFPVQVRLSTEHEKFQVAICSPGEVSPAWMVVLLTASGRPFSVVRTIPTFNPSLIND